MRSLFRGSRASVALLAVVVASCGPSQPQPHEPVVSASAAPAASAPAPAAKTGYDVSPVAEPAAIVGTARWKSPAALVQQAASGAGLPASALEAVLRDGVAEIFKDELQPLVDPKPMAEAVALDAPVDLVVILDPSPKRRDAQVAISIGLSSLERAKAAVGPKATITEVSPGTWKLGSKDRASSACVVAASAGATPARLVCGPKERDVTSLAPYLARNVAAQPAPASDLTAEFRMAPIEARFGREARQFLSSMPLFVEGSGMMLGEKRFDDALVQAASAVGEEASTLLSDLDRVKFDLTMGSGVQATGSATFRAKKAWITQGLFQNDKPGPAPTAFWRLPKDADTATFGRQDDPARYAPIFKVLRDLVEGALTKANVGSPADRKAIGDLLRTSGVKGATIVQASGGMGGFVPPTVGKAIGQKEVDAMLDGWLGWTLYGVEEPPAATIAHLKEIVGIYNRPALVGKLKKELGKDAKYVPTLKTVAAPAELGKDALAIEFKATGLPGNLLEEIGDGAKGPATFNAALHLLVMGDAGTTWIAFGSDKAKLVKRLVSVKAGTPEAETLAARSGLEGLKKGSNTSGGFFSLDGVVRSVEQSSGGALGNDPEVRAMVQALKAMPNKGTTPILLTGKSGGSQVEIGLTVAPGTLQDVASLAQAFAKMANAPTK